MRKKEGLTPPTAKSPFYQCRFYVGNKRHTPSTGETSYHAAWNVYQAKRREYGLPPDTNTDITIGQVMAEYERVQFKNLKAPMSHTKCIAALYRFWTPETPWHEITSTNGEYSIRQYVEHRRENDYVKDSTIRRELAPLCAAANEAINAGADIRNPRDLIKLNVKKPPYYYLNQDQAKALLDAAWRSPSADENDHALYDFIRISLYTGMRTSEVLQLEAERVVMVHRYIYLYDSKGSKPHQVPIKDDIVASLERRLAFAHRHQSPFLFVNPKMSARSGNTQPFKSFIKPFKSACKRAGIPVSNLATGHRGMRVYDLRHTFATWLVQSGVSLDRVADMLNHADIKMTQQYAHHSPSGRVSTLDKLPKL